MSLDTAKEEAVESLRRWNAVTGVLTERGAWYYELQTLMEDAVETGWKAAESFLDD